MAADSASANKRKEKYVEGNLDFRNCAENAGTGPIFCRLSMGVLMQIRSTRFGMSLGVLGSLTLLCTLPGYGP